MNIHQKNAPKKEAIPLPDKKTFHVMFEAHSAIMLMIDPQTGNIIEANQAAENFYGYPRSKLCSMKIQEINTLPPEQVAAELQKAYGGEGDYLIFPHRLESGQVRMVEILSSPITLNEKSLLFSIIHDITDRKQAEDAMANNEANFRNLAESTPDGILIASQEGDHFYANCQAAEMLGYTRQELLQTNLCDLAEPSAYPLLKQRLADRIAGRAVPKTYETIIRRKDGTNFPAEVTGSRTVWLDKVCDLVIFRDISERKQAELALQESERKLKALFEFLPVGVSVLDADGRVSYVNPALEQIMDITHDGLMHGDYRRRTYLRGNGTIMPSEEFASVRADHEQRAVYNVETGVVKENGQTVWTNVNAVPLAFPDWRVLMGTIDISARKSAEEKVAQLAAIVEYSDDIILSTSLDGTVMSWNKGAEFIYGYTEGEMVGRSISILAPPELNSEIPLILEKIKNGIQTSRFETTRLRKDGRKIQLSLTISPVRNMAGKIIGASTIGHDITARKLAEEKLSQLSRAVEHSSTAIVITDVEGRIEYVNPKFIRLNGYTLEEVSGKIPRLLKPDSEANNFYTQPWLTIQSGKEWHGEFLGRKKSGESYWSSASISPILNVQGDITHFVSVNEDITVRKATEEKIRSLNIELEKLSVTDYLTSLPNRRYFMRRGEEEFKRANRTNQPLALLMLDIDEFKKVNDTYGHEAGDIALQQVATALRSGLREIDIVGRMGGEEFAVLLPNTLMEEALTSAERVRESIANTAFEKVSSDLHITASIGVSVYTAKMSGIDDLLRNADSALYQAKNNSRNNVQKYVKS